MIRFPDVVVTQRHGVPSSVKANDTKPLNHHQQIQSQTQPTPKLNINFSSKNKKKNNQTYQLGGKKRNASNNNNNNNSNSHSNINSATTSTSNACGSTSSVSSSSSSSIGSGATAAVVAAAATGPVSSKHVSYAATKESSYASHSHSAKKIGKSEASRSTSLSLESISSADDSTPSAVMNLHLVKYLTNQHHHHHHHHQAKPTNGVTQPSSTSTAVAAVAAPIAVAAAAAAPTSTTQMATKKSTYTVEFLHKVGVQMARTAPMSEQNYHNTGRMRPHRTEFATYNGHGSKSHSQYSNANTDYGRYHNSNMNKFQTPHSKAHLSNASVSPPLSVVSSGSSSHSGRGSNHSNQSNHSNSMSYRNSQTYSIPPSHLSNYHYSNYYYHGSPFGNGGGGGGTGNANGSNVMQPQQQSQQQQQQQQSSYSSSHHHPSNQSNQKSLHQMPSPPIYHANNNYHSHNRNYQSGKKNWTSNYGRNSKKYANGNHYSSANSSSSNSSNASTGTNAANNNKFANAPKSADHTQPTATDRLRIEIGSKTSSTERKSTTPSPSLPSPIATTPIVSVGNCNYAMGGDAERGDVDGTAEQPYMNQTYLFSPSDASVPSLLTMSNCPADRNNHFTLPLSKFATPRHVDASTSPPICISPSAIHPVDPSRHDQNETKSATIMERSSSNSSMDRSDALNSASDANAIPSQSFHMDYSTSPTPAGSLITEEFYSQLNNVISHLPTPSASNNNNNTSSVSSGSASIDSTGSASMPIYNPPHPSLFVWKMAFYGQQDMINITNELNSKSTHDGPHQRRSYSGNSSPTLGNKTYRNNGQHRDRDRQFQSNRKSTTKSAFNPSNQLPDHLRYMARADNIELPRRYPESLCNHTVWDELSQHIWYKCVERQQTSQTYTNKMLFWKNLTSITQGHEFMSYSAHMVGSTISGFGLDTSDVDVCLVANISTFSNMDSRSEALLHLSELREHLHGFQDFTDFNLIQAKVPILRFKDDMHKVEIDLNYNNSVGIRNTHLLHCYSQMDWRLRPLALIVKIWAQFHYINNAKDMTISSYSLILMVIHFLQCAVQPPVLPCLHAMYPEKFHNENDISTIDMVEDIEPYLSDNKQPLGELFLQFLEYYSSFDYERNAISVRIAGVLPIEECRIVRSSKNEAHAWTNLCIEEPFDYTNTARSCYDEKIFERIKSVFVTSWHVLRDTMDLDKLFDEPFLAPPQNVAFDHLPLAPNYPLMAPFS